MERLTARDEYGSTYYPHCFREPCNGTAEPDDCATCDFNYQVCDRLAELEDREEPMYVYYESTADGDPTFAFCQRCGRIFDRKSADWDYDWCPDCGQRLGWAEDRK